jgi:hypothetical protein
MAVEFSSSLQSVHPERRFLELYFHVNNPHMVYQNELVNDTVGVSFRPTWFDPASQVGPTEVLVQRLIFPEAFVNDSLAVWYGPNPQDQINWTMPCRGTWRSGPTLTSITDDVAAGSYDVGIGFQRNTSSSISFPTRRMDIFGDIGPWCRFSCRSY